MLADASEPAWRVWVIGALTLVLVVAAVALRTDFDQGLPAASSGAPAADLPSLESGASQVAAPELMAAIQAERDRRGPALRVLSRAQKAELAELYRTAGYVPLWLDPAGSPDSDAREAVALLESAGQEGLDPADYGDVRLGEATASLEGQSAAASTELARFDVALSSGMLRYLRQLHMGRVDPRAIGLRLRTPADEHDFATILGPALAGHRVTAAAMELRPPFAQYEELVAMLARYRVLAADTTLQAPPSAAPVHPGESYAGLVDLSRLLVAFGDLPSGTPAPEGRYEGALVDGVKRFQVRHGLAPDGVVGTATMRALQVPVASRVRQIELALERLRWLPHGGGGLRVVTINIPMFHLWAWDAAPPRSAPALSMGVIVGRAVRTQSPVLVEQMREVIFRPYWNVPTSILRKEILPAIQRDPDYLLRQDMEIVQGQSDNALVVEATADNITRLGEGAFRLRQRPGPRNSLGLIKFVFPNVEEVYMHGTPAQALFARSRRDFSHGCVRVEDPVALAEWALKDRPEWSRDRIVSATAGSETVHVRLPRPIQVVLFYTTAVIVPDDGTIRFADDIYRHDARLDRALTGLSPAP